MECRTIWQLIFSIMFFIEYLMISANDSHVQLLFVNETKTWLQAHEYCKDMNGTLASKEDLLSVQIPKCARELTQVWTGDVIVLTPFISLKACVNPSDKPFATMTMTSVEQCAALCSTSSGFEIQKNNCRCFNGRIPVDNINASLCAYKCKEDDDMQFCGGENASNVYKFYDNEDRVLGEGNSDECLLTKCPVLGIKQIIKVVLQCNNSYNASKCKSQGSTIRHITNWLDAQQKCIEEYETYLIESHVIEDCNCSIGGNCSYCSSDNNITDSTWTSTRKYQGRIAAEDFELGKFKIKKCWYMNTSTSLSYGISDSCHSEDTRKRVVCKITFPSDVQTQCSSNIIEETSLDPMYVVNSTIERTIDGGKTSIVIPIVVAIGILIAIAVTLCSISLWKRGSCGGKKKTENNIVIEYNDGTNQRSEGIYVSTAEGEYDHLNVKRKVINPSNEQNIYNHATICRDDETYQKQDNKLEGSRELEILENTYSHATYQQSEMIEGEYDVTSRGTSAKHDNIGDNTYSTAADNVCVIDHGDTYSTTQNNIVNITGNTDKVSTDNVYSTTDNGL